MQQTDLSTTLTLEAVKQHFDLWRATRIKQSKIPDSLWSEVKVLMGRYPMSQITQALRVNAHQVSAGIAIKGNFNFVSVRPHSVPVPATKLVSSNQTNLEATCALEIHRPSGGILKISTFPITSLAAIINQFMES